MRLLDFQIETVLDAPIPVDPAVMASNAKAATSLVNWRKTEVVAPRGALLCRYLRDSASDEPEESASDEEPEEEISDAQMMDSVEKFLRLYRKDISVAKPKPVVSRNVTYATDAAFVARHLDPNQLCSDAFQELQPRAHAMQTNNAYRGFWEGLCVFLKGQPAGTKIKDIQNKACLSTLVSKTLAA